MKRIIVLALAFFGFFYRGGAQSKVERYCLVDLHNKGLSNKMVAELRLGEHPEYFAFKDSTVLQNLYKVNSMATATDVLNYMASMGWKWVYTTGYTWFYFKREFDPSELANH